MKYSNFSLARAALSGHKTWKPTWRDPAPKSRYDVVIIGGGGHGLATAYFLAREYGIRNVAVLEKGWIGSGNAGRNTTIIRSNYGLPGNVGFYELSMKLWELMEQDLNYNAMVSQRGVINLYHSDAQRDAFAVTLWRGKDRTDGQAVFNLLVFATFAESLWHTMLDAAAEYGVAIAHSEELG